MVRLIPASSNLWRRTMPAASSIRKRARLLRSGARQPLMRRRSRPMPSSISVPLATTPVSRSRVVFEGNYIAPLGVAQKKVAKAKTESEERDEEASGSNHGHRKNSRRIPRPNRCRRRAEVIKTTDRPVQFRRNRSFKSADCADCWKLRKLICVLGRTKS